MMEALSGLNANASSSQAWLFSIINSVLIQPLVTGGLTLLVFNICTSREKSETPVGWFNLVKPFYGKLVGTQIALSVLMVGFSIAFVLLIVALSLAVSSFLSDLFSIIVMLALFVPFILGLSVYSMLAFPVAISESRYGLKFVGRAFRLLFLQFFKSLGLVLATTMLVSVISSVLGFAFAFLPPLLRTALGVAANCLLSPVSAIAAVLLYLDIRISKEGYDLELRNAMLNNQTEEAP